MKSAKFYIMPPLDSDFEPVSKIPAHFIWACQLAQQSHRQGRKLHLFCNNETDAKWMSELIWQLDSAQFVPHTLPGEGSIYGAPVAIIWQAPHDKRPLLINLSDAAPTWASNLKQVVDFVPSNEAQKELARERYKQYRQLGFTLETQQCDASNQKEDRNHG